MYLNNSKSKILSGFQKTSVHRYILQRIESNALSLLTFEIMSNLLSTHLCTSMYDKRHKVARYTNTTIEQKGSQAIWCRLLQRQMFRHKHSVCLCLICPHKPINNPVLTVMPLVLIELYRYLQKNFTALTERAT